MRLPAYSASAKVICFIEKLGDWCPGILPNQEVFFRISLDAADLPSPEVLAGESMAELIEALHELEELMKALGAGDEVEAQRRLMAEVMGLAVIEGAGNE
ncbi:hypothetical protein HBN79_15140 [Pseudomonas sp. WS 5051]|nr:hypothetical protein [Pseudomonas sp. WS 5051]